MASLKARLLGGWIGDRFLRDTQVTEVRDLGPKFRHVTLAGEAMRAAPCAPGDKVQIYIEDAEVRTYTPFAFDPERGKFEIVAYLHGDEPGTRWARSLTVGTRVRVFGPRDSIALVSLTGSIALFGDETSFAVARSLVDLRAQTSRPAPTLVLEVASRADCEIAREALGLPADCLMERTAASLTAFPIACAQRLVASETIVLTGSAQSIQRVRAEIRNQPRTFVQKVKPYWSKGKRGLD